MVIRVIQYGMGSIGIELVRLLLKRGEDKRFVGGREKRLTGAVDINEDIAGKDVGDILGINKLGVMVSKDPSGTICEGNADLVLHSTTSKLVEVKPQLIQCVQAKMNVISTCEELAYPIGFNARIAEEIGREAKRFGVTVLGTGVNPGFVMDALPVFLSTICKNIEKVEVTRIVNASLRREPLQRKIGAGITVEEFQHKVEEKKLGHVGLLESLVMIAATLGWDLAINETIEPIIAKNALKTEYFEIEPGKVAGIFQTATGFKNGENKLKLVLRMEIDAKEQYDRTQIFGEPNVDMKIQNGLFGDDATVAIAVNLIDAVVDSPPGFLTMKDLPFLPHLT
ncbi:MAG: NAD(P)H-dependent amine dehydrogenase family protein [Candidatus Sifarchaeia archaeon]